MDTSLLKSFATSSRTELIREVAARITAVLAQGSPERVEQPRAVSELERAISAGGGVDKGKAHVADRVAYTWFNRIIALRFMDANGYTGIGVVSPAADQVGQPEILAAAKRGQVDGDVVKSTNAATVAGLLNGTRQPRPGVDAQAEAYSLLLADYCRYWNRAMSFMFEHEGDYTELLIPANVLAEDSVLSRSVNVLTEDVCQDVEVIGWLYQFYISERKDEVFAGFKKNKKAGADEIPAATQLFTPHWIVRYLVENSVGRLWMLNHPESRLVDQMDYYIAPVDEETDFLKITKPEELTVIDPACGSGHMLTYAFDLLYAIYEEEGYTPSQIPGLILTNNLYGTEIDPRAGALAAFALTMKAAAKRKLFLKNPVAPKICVLAPIAFTVDELSYLVTENGDRHAEEKFWNQFSEADTFGSLIQPNRDLTVRLASYIAMLDDEGDIFRADALDRAQKVVRQAEYLLPRYSTAVANPPYMGMGNMSTRLAEFAKESFSISKADLFAMFIERCVALVQLGGNVGMITMHTWMFIASFEKLRSALLASTTIQNLAHLGTGAFDSIGGEVVSTVAFVLSVGEPSAVKGSYLRLVEAKGESGKSAAALAAIDNPESLVYRRTQTIFKSIPGAPIAYWLSDSFYRAFAENRSLGDIATPRTGMRTGDNARFLRLWHEVSLEEFSIPGGDSLPETKWVVYAKGGPSRRWFGNLETVVNWANGGYEIKEETLRNYPQLSWDNLGWKISNETFFYQPGITWTDMSTTAFGARLLPPGCIFDAAGPSMFGDDARALLGLLNSTTAFAVLTLLNPTLHFKNYNISAIPLPDWSGIRDTLEVLATKAVELVRGDWAESETSWEFGRDPLVERSDVGRLREATELLLDAHGRRVSRLQSIETTLNQRVVEAYEVDTVEVEANAAELTLTFNTAAVGDKSDLVGTYIENFLSYAVGCMFGRYSLDAPGLILADQGATLQDFLVKVPNPVFTPDSDNVIPLVDGDWFEDDIVQRFRQFLRAAFGEQYFEENLQFVTKSLGVKHLRDYFVKSFYKGHIKRYKKRPIYWLFSSPKGSFNALIYMHRYTPSTVSTVLTYLREYVTKLESALQQAERAGIAKEADRLRKILVELNEYEHDTLFPKASENVVIDLDDGVKVNYPEFGAALKKIPGLEAASD